MVNAVLYGLPTFRSKKGSFFDVDMVGDTTSSTVFVSVVSIYWRSFMENLSVFMYALKKKIKEGGIEISLKPEKGYIRISII